MNRYDRLPALYILAGAMVISGIYLAASARGRGNGPAASLADIEKAIASGKNDVETWLAYAQKLQAAKPPQYARALEAYQRVLKLQPFNRDAWSGRATVLAESRRSDELYKFLEYLIGQDPKLVVGLLERQEFKEALKPELFADVQNRAKREILD